MRDVLLKIQGDWPAARIDELLPAQWAAAHAPKIESPAPQPST